MLTHFLDRVGCNLLHSIEQTSELQERLFLLMVSVVHLVKGFDRLNFTFFIDHACLDWKMLLVRFVPSDNLLKILDHNCVLLPDQVQCQLSFNVKEVFTELAWQIRVQNNECLESDPQFESWQIELFKHLLHAQIVDVLAVQVDDTRVDQEALLEDVVVHNVWHGLIQ